VPPSSADDGANPSAGEGGLPIRIVDDVGVDGDAQDARADAIDADASLVDIGGSDAGPPDVGPADTGDACSPTTETCDATDEDCDGMIDEDTTCPCPRYTYGGSTYLFCTGTDTWAGSRDRCRAVGYELVSIESAAEDAWLWATIDAMSTDEVWIGLSDLASEGTYVWPDGTVQRTPAGDVTYGGWIPGRPDTAAEHCVEMDRGAAGAWEDVDCSQSQNAICEAP